MVYSHRQGVLDQANSAPSHERVNNLTIHDVHQSILENNTDQLISAIALIKAGEPFPVHYPGPTVVYVIEGELVGEDWGNPGEKFRAKAGDVLHFAKDTHVTYQEGLETKALGVTYLSTNVKSMNEFIIKN